MESILTKTPPYHSRNAFSSGVLLTSVKENKMKNKNFSKDFIGFFPMNNFYYFKNNNSKFRITKNQREICPKILLTEKRERYKKKSIKDLFDLDTIDNFINPDKKYHSVNKKLILLRKKFMMERNRDLKLFRLKTNPFFYKTNDYGLSDFISIKHKTNKANKKNKTKNLENKEHNNELNELEKYFKNNEEKKGEIKTKLILKSKMKPEDKANSIDKNQTTSSFFRSNKTKYREYFPCRLKDNEEYCKVYPKGRGLIFTDSIWRKKNMNEIIENSTSINFFKAMRTHSKSFGKTITLSSN